MSDKHTWSDSKVAQPVSKFENHAVTENLSTNVFSDPKFFEKNNHAAHPQVENGKDKVPVADIAKDGSISFGDHAKAADDSRNNAIGRAGNEDDSRNRRIPHDAPANSGDKNNSPVIPDYLKEIQDHLL